MNFRELHNALLDLDEATITKLLDQERVSKKPRRLVLERLHQRLCILRAKRERAAIMRECNLQ